MRFGILMFHAVLRSLRSFRVPAMYFTWVNSVFLSFFSFNGISNLRVFNVAFSSIPTAPTKPVLFSVSCNRNF
jgi:hypothetical protein